MLVVKEVEAAIQKILKQYWEFIDEVDEAFREVEHKIFSKRNEPDLRRNNEAAIYNLDFPESQDNSSIEDLLGNSHSSYSDEFPRFTEIVQHSSTPTSPQAPLFPSYKVTTITSQGTTVNCNYKKFINELYSLFEKYIHSNDVDDFITPMESLETQIRKIIIEMQMEFSL